MILAICTPTGDMPRWERIYGKLQIFTLVLLSVWGVIAIITLGVMLVTA